MLQGIWKSPRSRERLIILVFLYFTFLGGTFITDQRFWPRVVHHLIVTILLSTWLVMLVRQRRSFPRSPLDWPILAYLLVKALATIFAVDPRVSVENWWQLGVHTLMFYLLLDVMRTFKSDTLLKPMFFAASVVILVGTFEFISWYFGLGWLPIFRQSWFEIGGLRDPFPPTIYRLNFTLGVATYLSGYLALLIPVGLGFLIATRKKDTRQMLIVWLIGAVVVEILSYSRGGILSLAVSLPTLSVLVLASDPSHLQRIRALWRDWRVRIIALSVTAAVIVVGIGWASRRFEARADSDTLRFDLFRGAWLTGLEHPWIGVGPGGFGRAYRLVRTPALAQDHFTSPHDYLLLLWADAGLPGVLALSGLVMVTAWLGYRRWRKAAGRDRLRISGVCAGLLGFSVHNLFDTLGNTPILLPIFILAAYLALPFKRERHTIPIFAQRPRLAPLITLTLVGLSVIGWGVSDYAQYHFDRAIRLFDAGNLTGALEAIETAHRIDPAMGFYAAQRAQFLGQLAVQDEAYLPEALSAYQTAFDYEDTSDVMLANYASLLALSGDLEMALEAADRAAHIRPGEGSNWVLAGSIAEASGNHEAAQTYYSLLFDPTLLEGLESVGNIDGIENIGSDYWQSTPDRISGQQQALQSLGLEDVPPAVLNNSPFQCWDAFARVYRDESPVTDTSIDLMCVGEAFLRERDDPTEAIRWLDRAIEAAPEMGRSYVLRAEAQLALGHQDEAERDALIARFLGEYYADYVLGQIAESRGDLDLASELYVSAGPGEIQYQGWDVAVFARRGSIMLLKTFDEPGPAAYELAPWTALMRLYESQGRDGDAQNVKEAILRIDPYFDFGAQ